MRLSLLMPAILLATVAFGTRAEAQNYPWCAQYTGDMGGSMNCGFVSYDQCMLDVSGVGGFCIVNNTYQPAVPATARKHHVRNDS